MPEQDESRPLPESGPEQSNSEQHNHTEKDGGLGAALEYASQELPCLPLNGKRPLIAAWPKQASTDPEVLREWWDRWPGANIGIVTGARSGRVVIDVDKEELPEGLPPTRFRGSDVPVRGAG